MIILGGTRKVLLGNFYIEIKRCEGNKEGFDNVFEELLYFYKWIYEIPVKICKVYI